MKALTVDKIMDKKMDSGYLEVGETMEDEFDFMQTLLPDEIIGVIDQLLRLEVYFSGRATLK